MNSSNRLGVVVRTLLPTPDAQIESPYGSDDSLAVQPGTESTRPLLRETTPPWAQAASPSYSPPPPEELAMYDFAEEQVVLFFSLSLPLTIIPSRRNTSTAFHRSRQHLRRHYHNDNGSHRFISRRRRNRFGSAMRLRVSAFCAWWRW